MDGGRPVRAEGFVMGDVLISTQADTELYVMDHFEPS